MLFAVEFDPQAAVQVGGILAILTWIVKFWLPKLTDDFRQDITAARASAATQSELARQIYASECKEARDAYKVSLNQIMQHCLEEGRENRAFHQKERDTMLAHIERIRRGGHVAMPEITDGQA